MHLLQVVSAHAASIGDNLLGVPLNCSAGLNADAVTVLQEAGRWQSAAVLIARALTGTERAQALSRWSSHVLHHEGGVWQCAGLLTAAGCLSAALQVGFLIQEKLMLLPVATHIHQHHADWWLPSLASQHTGAFFVCPSDMFVQK